MVLALGIGHQTLSQETASKVSIIGVLAFDNVLTSEVTAPMEVFGAATRKKWLSSYSVLLISGTNEKKIVTEEGLQLIADATIYDALELDVLIVPGGYDLDALTGNEVLMAFVHEKGKKATWLSSNCSGAFLLAHAGLLDNVKATTWAGGEADLKRAYPKVDVQFDKNVVIDGKVITSNGGAVSYLAAFKLLSKLSSPEHAKEIADLLQFSRL